MPPPPPTAPTPPAAPGAPAAPDEGRLRAWLAERGRAATELLPLAGDVSPRRYWRARLAAGGHGVVAFYPAEVREDCERFRRSTRLLANAGVRVPEVIEADCASGLMLVEDVGAATLYDLRGRPWDEIEPYFDAAAGLCAAIAALPAAPVAELNPPLGLELLRAEVEQTWDLFLAPHGLTGDARSAAELRDALEAMCERLAAEPPRPCHRDFMVRNLVPAGPSPGLAVLDHQGLRQGPPGYDLASLLNDSLFAPPGAERALLARLLGDDPRRRERYHRAAAQRTLKAVGTYAAFARRGFDRHLVLVPATLGRALGHLRRLPEAATVVARLEPLWRGSVEPYLLD